MSKTESKKSDEKTKEYSCYFVGETFVEAKNEDEAREKAWEKLLCYGKDFINLKNLEINIYIVKKV